jgi:hypothetical protein
MIEKLEQPSRLISQMVYKNQKDNTDFKIVRQWEWKRMLKVLQMTNNRIYRMEQLLGTATMNKKRYHQLCKLIKKAKIDTIPTLHFQSG